MDQSEARVFLKSSNTKTTVVNGQTYFGQVYSDIDRHYGKVWDQNGVTKFTTQDFNSTREVWAAMIILIRSGAILQCL